jgi:hypothetical protein
VRGFWKRRGRGSDLEGALRANRPEPRTEFVRLMTARIHESRPHVAARRVAVAAALTLMIAAALVAFGGIGYAGTAAQQVEKLARGLSSTQHANKPHRGKPGHDQYQEERKQCRRAERQRHLAAMRDIRADFRECKREENQRHDAALKACGKDKACKAAEMDRHKAELARCREEFQRRKREEQERHQAALKACSQIGGGSATAADDDDDGGDDGGEDGD